MLITLKLLASQENLEQFWKMTTFGTPKMCNSNKAGFYWLLIEIIEISLHKHIHKHLKNNGQKGWVEVKTTQIWGPFSVFFT